MNRSRCLFRGLTALLAVLVAVSSFCLPASASAFSDVTRSAYYAYFDAINYVSDNGYMAGTGNGKFSPDRTLNRGMFVTVLYSFAGKPLATGTIPFTDVSSTAYYYNAVRWAYANGVLSGTTSTTFSPDMEVNREQAMVFLKSYAVKWLGKAEYYCETVTSAGDYSNISTWARDAMRWAVSNGILIRANASSNLYPKAAADRKELALWICRFGQNVIGMDTTRDTFSFRNRTADFVSIEQNRYLISPTHWTRLMSAAANEAEKNAIRSMYDGPWLGACFGMSLVCILDKTGQIDFNKNYASTCPTMYSIPSPRIDQHSSHHIPTVDRMGTYSITQTESAINYYLLSQKLTSIIDPKVYAKPLSKASQEDDSELEGAVEFVSAMSHSGLVLMNIGMATASSAHSIIVYGYPQITTNQNGTQLYTYHVYDPNNPSNTTFVLRKSRNSFDRCTFAGSSVVAAYYYTDFHIFNAFDIDGAGNNIQSVPNMPELQ